MLQVVRVAHELTEYGSATVPPPEDFLCHEAPVVLIGELALEAEELAQLPLDPPRSVAEQQWAYVRGQDEEAESVRVQLVSVRVGAGQGKQVSGYQDVDVGRPADETHDYDQGAYSGRPGFLAVLEKRTVAYLVLEVVYVAVGALNAGHSVQGRRS